MSISIKLSAEAASDVDSVMAVLRRLMYTHVTVSTPHHSASGFIMDLGWSDKHECYGFFLGELSDPRPAEFVPFDYENMEVVYS